MRGWGWFPVSGFEGLEGEIMSSTANYPRIELSADRVPYIAGMRIKVIEVVQDRLYHGWDVDEIHRQHPHLSLTEIHSALAYYDDHQEEMDKDIENRRRQVEEILAKLGESPIVGKMRTMGYVP